MAIIGNKRSDSSVPVSSDTQKAVAGFEITCPKYRKLPGSKACQHFEKGGACKLPDFLLCTEWVKRHPKEAQGYEGKFALPLAAPSQDGGRVELTPKPAARHPDSFNPDLLTTGMIDQLAAKGYEFELDSPELGTVYLVPRYTESDRTELSFEDARTLTLIANTLPGARVKSITRKGSR